VFSAEHWSAEYRSHRETIAFLLLAALIGALFFGAVLSAWIAWVLM
jgi:hypothetical protein